MFSNRYESNLYINGSKFNLDYDITVTHEYTSNKLTTKIESLKLYNYNYANSDDIKKIELKFTGDNSTNVVFTCTESNQKQFSRSYTVERGVNHITSITSFYSNNYTEYLQESVKNKKNTFIKGSPLSDIFNTSYVHNLTSQYIINAKDNSLLTANHELASMLKAEGINNMHIVGSNIEFGPPKKPFKLEIMQAPVLQGKILMALVHPSTFFNISIVEYKKTQYQITKYSLVQNTRYKQLYAYINAVKV